jgi:hypothetical protein
MTSNQPPTGMISLRFIPRRRDLRRAIASSEPGIEMTPAAAFAPSKSPDYVATLGVGLRIDAVLASVKADA